MIAIVDYKAGNLTSVRLAFEHLGVNVEVTQSAERILAAERVVFPGVGAAQAAMESIEALKLKSALEEVVRRGTPFLGICLGTQIILEHSEEDNGADCLGLVPGRVVRFRPTDPADKVPQMGWNTVRFTRSHPVFNGVENESEFYFVHSYYPAPSDSTYILGETQYAGATFASILGKNNLIAMQFHPERSGRIGLQLLKNFSVWNGQC